MSQTHGFEDPFDMREAAYLKYLKDAADDPRVMRIPDDPAIQLLVYQVFQTGWMSCWAEWRDIIRRLRDTG
jgi:hypothetical protein